MTFQEFIKELLVQRATEVLLQRAHGDLRQFLDFDGAAEQAKKDVAGLLRSAADVLEGIKEGA